MQIDSHIPRQITSAEIYKMALDTRNLEINLFWQRCNYFLILNSALAYAYLRHGEPLAKLREPAMTS